MAVMKVLNAKIEFVMWRFLCSNLNVCMYVYIHLLFIYECRNIYTSTIATECSVSS